MSNGTNLVGGSFEPCAVSANTREVSEISKLKLSEPPAVKEQAQCFQLSKAQTLFQKNPIRRLKYHTMGIVVSCLYFHRITVLRLDFCSQLFDYCKYILYILLLCIVGLLISQDCIFLIFYSLLSYQFFIQWWWDLMVGQVHVVGGWRQGVVVVRGAQAYLSLEQGCGT